MNMVEFSENQATQCTDPHAFPIDSDTSIQNTTTDSLSCINDVPHKKSPKIRNTKSEIKEGVEAMPIPNACSRKETAGDPEIEPGTVADTSITSVLSTQISSTTDIECTSFSSTSGDPPSISPNNNGMLSEAESQKTKVHNKDSSGATVATPRHILLEFADVLRYIDLDELLAAVRESHIQVVGTKRAEDADFSLGERIFGGEHVVYPVHIDGEPLYVVKISSAGTQGSWKERDKTEMLSEVQTMRFLKRKTTIPLPTILSCSCVHDNKVGCPYIIMTFISGLSLDDVWYGGKDRGLTEDEIHQCRVQVIEDVAAAMVQLDCVASSFCGIPVYDDGDNFIGVDDGTNGDLTQKCTSSKDYYNLIISMYEERKQRSVGLVRLLRVLADSVPETEDACPFVLVHPDFNTQNFIVSSTGKLRGVIDWSGPRLQHRTNANEGYPAWLAQDWVNNDYYFDFGVPFVYKDPIESLNRYRKVYRDQIDKIQAARGVVRNWSLTAASLVTQTLENIADDWIGEFRALDKLLSAMKTSSTEYLTIPKYLVRLFRKKKVPETMLESLKSDFKKLITGNNNL